MVTSLWSVSQSWLIRASVCEIVCNNNNVLKTMKYIAACSYRRVLSYAVLYIVNYSYLSSDVISFIQQNMIHTNVHNKKRGISTIVFLYKS